MSQYDIAVIGAGAAGLAAGLNLQSSGRSLVVLEARDRIGGRAFTDTKTLGLPFDCGAHWLHAARTNPFRKIADRLGIRYNDRLSWDDWMLHVGGRPAPEAMTEEAGLYMDQVLSAAAAAGAEGRDAAYAEFLVPGNRWNPLTRRVIGQITSHDAEDCSTLDSARYEDEGGDFPVEDGYGTLVARHAGGLAVTLETPVTHIDWSVPGVRIETPRGTLTARVIILAVPVNVLNADTIRFTPALPAALVQAFHDCPMGVSEKMAMLLDRPVEGLGHLYGDVVIPGEGPANTFNLHVNPFGRPLLVSHMAGSYGRDIERLGDAEAEALAIEAAVEAFGSGMRKRITKILRTHWASDPFTLGGYSHARPGHAASRLLFGETVGERIVLAGEHCSIPSFSTVHGAHLSGIAAAQKAKALLDG
jgi:monoamine oxidase